MLLCNLLAGRYSLYLPDALGPPQQAVRSMLMWSFTVLTLLLTQHRIVGDMSKEALLDHKEQRRLHRLAAKVTGDDYQRTGPAAKTEDELKHTQFRREVAQKTLSFFRAEMGAYRLSHCATSVYCSKPVPLYTVRNSRLT